MREDRLQAERAAAQAGHEHELAMMRGRGEIELQRVEAEKIAHYQHYLQYGGVAAWALHLARHPEDSQLVMENLRKDQLDLIKSQMNVALEILKKDSLEDYQREGMGKHAAEIFEEFMSRGSPGAAPVPPLPDSLPWGAAASREDTGNDRPVAEGAPS
jgi:hypothetical protein